jgi:hypothetical protein
MIPKQCIQSVQFIRYWVFATISDAYHFFVPSKNWAIYAEDHDFSESYHVSSGSFESFIHQFIEMDRS